MDKISILFVCLGNICRSPSAEAVFKAIIKEKGVEDKFYVDSAGTAGYNAGSPADSRSIAAGKRRGYNLDSISRQFYPSQDFDKFDHIIVMDSANLRDLKRLAETESELSKISMMMEYSTKFDNIDVPDPYYLGLDGFEQVLDILEDSCLFLYKFFTKS